MSLFKVTLEELLEFSYGSIDDITILKTGSLKNKALMITKHHYLAIDECGAKCLVDDRYNYPKSFIYQSIVSTCRTLIESRTDGVFEGSIFLPPRLTPIIFGINDLILIAFKKDYDRE
jgi:hypothetical protein